MTIKQLCEAFGVLPHTARAMVSVHPRKRGLTVERTGPGHYRIVA